MGGPPPVRQTVMGDTSASRTTQLPKLLIKLNRDQMTGMVTVKDDRRSLRIHLRQGHVVSADGLDAESRLIKEIAGKKGLSPEEVQELQRIRQKDPHAFGRTLVERGIVSSEIWNRFLVLKVKQTLAAAFQMHEANLGFSESAVDIPPPDLIDYNLFQLLVETVKGMKDEASFKLAVPGPAEVFDTSPEAETLKSHVALSPSEERILSLVDGRRDVGEILAAGDMDEPGLKRTLYLLLAFGMIQPTGGRGGAVNYGETVHLYLDLLKIIEANFRKEVGKQFEKFLTESLMELGARTGALFEGLDLSRDTQDDFARQVAATCESENEQRDGTLFLKSSFNKLVYLLIMRMKKVLGVSLTEKTIREMMNILDYVEKYRKDTEMMNYVKGNLEDYLKQVKA